MPGDVCRIQEWPALQVSEDHGEQSLPSHGVTEENAELGCLIPMIRRIAVGFKQGLAAAKMLD